jgi:16S rRNA (adenine1518-N6/adenine1519-N6)-dimethyltransferase
MIDRYQMKRVKAKKNLGQHFLKDDAVAREIAYSVSVEGYQSVLEIGPGMGILTRHLLERNIPDFRVIEIDNESVSYLRANLPNLKNLITGDFLRLDLDSTFEGKLGIIGNFPYNISSQILFRVLENRDKVVEVTGMFQKEVAERICSGPGKKSYGILSVLISAFYNTEYLLTVSENQFSPPPKVKSGVIRLKRNSVQRLECDEKLFFRVVKGCFNQRRKTLRNSVRAAFPFINDDHPQFGLRPEQLSVEEFVSLTRWISDRQPVSE